MILKNLLWNVKKYTNSIEAAAIVNSCMLMPGSYFGGVKTFSCWLEAKEVPGNLRFASHVDLSWSETVDFDLIKAMKVKELKIYLQMRGLKVLRGKEEIIARVFAAKENNVQPIKPTH